MDKTIVTMTSELEMLGFLKTNGTQCRFVSLLSQTPVVKIRVGNPWHTIRSGKIVGECNLFKVSRKIGIVNANYNTSVRNRIAAQLGVKLAEVEYENGEVWYEHLLTGDKKPLPVVQHKDEAKRQGQFYLQYFPQSSTDAYCNGKGEPVQVTELEPWLYKESERPEFKPCVIAVNLRNIKRLKSSGVVIEMPALEEAEAILADA